MGSLVAFPVRPSRLEGTPEDKPSNYNQEQTKEKTHSICKIDIDNIDDDDDDDENVAGASYMESEDMEFLGEEGVEDEATGATSKLYEKIVQLLGKKKKTKTLMKKEPHVKVRYRAGTQQATGSGALGGHDPKVARRTFAEMMKWGFRGGSLEEKKLLVHQESGYSSPNISAQHTPTAHHRLANPLSGARKQSSLELAPQRSAMPSRPRMSLPSEQLKRHFDGRCTEAAAERRLRLSREKAIIQDDSFPPPLLSLSEAGISGFPGRSNTPLLTSSGRMIRPSSSSREESTEEESGFEEDEPVEIRVPPLVEEERRDSSSSTITQHQESTELQPEWSIPYDQLRFGHLTRKGSTISIYRYSYFEIKRLSLLSYSVNMINISCTRFCMS